MPQYAGNRAMTKRFDGTFDGTLFLININYYIYQLYAYII